jgi:probable lipoprotein NlpC
VLSLSGSGKSAALFIVLSALVIGGCGTSKRAVEAERETGNLIPSRRAIVKEAKAWLGAPYRAGGVDKGGTDCSGLVYRVFGRAGIKLPRTASDMFSKGKAVSMRDLCPGDLVFFRNTAGRGITHVGIAIGGASFIHSSTTRGVIVSGLDESYYRRHYAGARNVLGRCARAGAAD